LLEGGYSVYGVKTDDPQYKQWILADGRFAINGTVSSGWYQVVLQPSASS
jgi:hypothetical protein